MTNYYVGEIGIDIENLPNILENRIQAIQRIEATDDYLHNEVYDGKYEDIHHPNLIKLIKHFEQGEGYASIYKWADGECLHAHWDFDN